MDFLFADHFSGEVLSQNIHKCKSLDRTLSGQGLKHTYARRGNRTFLSQNLSASLLVILCGLITLSSVQAQNAEDFVWLDGVGYREQELQVSKGTNFASEEAEGVKWASYGGGTHIFIKGVGLNVNP
jgi:hypothetical protein